VGKTIYVCNNGPQLTHCRTTGMSSSSPKPLRPNIGLVKPREAMALSSRPQSTGIGRAINATHRSVKARPKAQVAYQVFTTWWLSWSSSRRHGIVPEPQQGKYHASNVGPPHGRECIDAFCHVALSRVYPIAKLWLMCCDVFERGSAGTQAKGISEHKTMGRRSGRHVFHFLQCRYVVASASQLSCAGISLTSASGIPESLRKGNRERSRAKHKLIVPSI
jgi:hypothetical protein